MMPAVHDAAASIPAAGIDRRERLPYADFVRAYLKTLRPVAIAGALDGWPAARRWTPRFFAERYPDKELTLKGRTYRMAEFIDLVERPHDGPAVPYLFS